MTKTYPDIVVVDEHDVPIGAMQLPDAHKQGAITRVSRVFVLNSKGEVLLQKRSQFVYAPGLYSESAAGHVDAGEDYLQAARRELQEEIGVIADLKQCAYYFHEEPLGEYSIKRFNTLFLTHSDGPFIVEPEEVEHVEFVSLAELDNRINYSPHLFPEGFIFAFNEYKKAVHKG